MSKPPEFREIVVSANFHWDPIFNSREDAEEYGRRWYEVLIERLSAPDVSPASIETWRKECQMEGHVFPDQETANTVRRLVGLGPATYDPDLTRLINIILGLGREWP